MTSPHFEWVPIKEYAADIGVSLRTVRRWIQLGDIEGKRIGPRPRGRWVVKVVSPDVIEREQRA